MIIDGLTRAKLSKAIQSAFPNLKMLRTALLTQLNDDIWNYAGIDDGSLERMLEPTRGFTDVGQMLQRLGKVVNSVCQISYPVSGGITYGTGFLIGDSTLLTNWLLDHSPFDPQDLSIRSFDEERVLFRIVREVSKSCVDRRSVQLPRLSQMTDEQFDQNLLLRTS